MRVEQSGHRAPLGAGRRKEKRRRPPGDALPPHGQREREARRQAALFPSRGTWHSLLLLANTMARPRARQETCIVANPPILLHSRDNASSCRAEVDQPLARGLRALISEPLGFERSEPLLGCLAQSSPA
jgi:hypothetical protein